MTGNAVGHSARCGSLTLLLTGKSTIARASIVIALQAIPILAGCNRAQASREDGRGRREGNKESMHISLPPKVSHEGGTKPVGSMWSSSHQPIKFLKSNAQMCGKRLPERRHIIAYRVSVNDRLGPTFGLMQRSKISCLPLFLIGMGQEKYRTCRRHWNHGVVHCWNCGAGQ